MSKKNQIDPEVELQVSEDNKIDLIGGMNEALRVVSKASAKVYTKGGNDVYSLVKKVRKHIRAARAEIVGGSRPTAEALNAELARIMAG